MIWRKILSPGSFNVRFRPTMTLWNAASYFLFLKNIGGDRTTDPSLDISGNLLELLWEGQSLYVLHNYGRSKKLISGGYVRLREKFLIITFASKFLAKYYTVFTYCTTIINCWINKPWKKFKPPKLKFSFFFLKLWILEIHNFYLASKEKLKILSIVHHRHLFLF